MTTPNNPIVNAGLLYVNGLRLISSVNSPILTLVSGAARDSTNVNDIILPSNITLNGTTVGANGVDLAPLIANSFYAIYVIGDSTAHHTTAGLFSLSSTNPILPLGYDMFRRVGWIKTDGSANILPFSQSGIDQIKNYYYVTPINVLTSGSSTTYTPIALTAAVPQLPNNINTEAMVNINYTAASAANSVQFSISNLGGAGPTAQFGCGVTGAQEGTLILPVSTVFDLLFYKVGAGDTVTLNVTAYKDYIA